MGNLVAQVEAQYTGQNGLITKQKAYVESLRTELPAIEAELARRIAVRDQVSRDRNTATTELNNAMVRMQTAQPSQVQAIVGQINAFKTALENLTTRFATAETEVTNSTNLLAEKKTFIQAQVEKLTQITSAFETAMAKAVADENAQKIADARANNLPEITKLETQAQTAQAETALKSQNEKSTTTIIIVAVLAIAFVVGIAIWKRMS